MLENLLQKSESYRKKVAMAATGVVFVAVFVSWGVYRGFLFQGGEVAQVEEEDNLAAVVESAASPWDNTSKVLGDAFKNLGEQYQALKQSVSDVLVPFITGIEVYETK